MEDLQSFELLLKVIDALGGIGVLIFLVWAFYRGDLIPKSILNRILEVYEKQMADMTERILTRLDEALAEAKE